MVWLCLLPPQCLHVENSTDRITYVLSLVGGMSILIHTCVVTSVWLHVHGDGRRVLFKEKTLNCTKGLSYVKRTVYYKGLYYVPRNFFYVLQTRILQLMYRT